MGHQETTHCALVIHAFGCHGSDNKERTREEMASLDFQNIEQVPSIISFESYDILGLKTSRQIVQTAFYFAQDQMNQNQIYVICGPGLRLGLFDVTAV